MAPACSSDTFTNVLPHKNAMPQTRDMTSYPITVYRHGADLSLCYPLMLNVTLESIPDLPHTPANAQLYDAVMVVVSRKLNRKYRINQFLNPGPLACKSITLSACPQLQ